MACICTSNIMRLAMLTISTRPIVHTACSGCGWSAWVWWATKIYCLWCSWTVPNDLKCIQASFHWFQLIGYASLRIVQMPRCQDLANFMAMTMTDRQIALSLAHACTWGDYYNHVSWGNHQNGLLKKVISSYCMKCTKNSAMGTHIT